MVKRVRFYESPIFVGGIFVGGLGEIRGGGFFVRQGETSPVSLSDWRDTRDDDLGGMRAGLMALLMQKMHDYLLFEMRECVKKFL